MSDRGPGVRLRPAETADLPRVQDVERAAGEAFRALGMAAVADDDPPSLDVLAAHREAGRAWVAVEEGTGEIVGYLLLGLEPVDGNGHVERLSVHPDHARRGTGRRLLELAADVTRAQGRPALTLTTFADVPWNAPWYRRLGFGDVPDPGPQLRALVAREAGLGLGTWPRVCLALDLALDPTGPVLREMRWWDVDDVHALETELFGRGAWSVEAFWGELAQPNRCFLVAEEDGRVVGYGGIVVAGADADVQTVGVARDQQGRGTGRALLRELRARAVAAGATHLLLEVRADNAPAQHLYRSEGFEQIARRARYYQPEDVDALVLRARIS
ncbi:ribosomal protein S18-alanine N-acetyltransferase [Kineococcus sp. LSe6-4]|uniref:Ribosomal protein S18-alanine N-acetyltransferase n=1 Tax=Kineococcus halophytocola TaxID=3234027 RepID=A0ABV4H0F9_9ACTN